MKRDISNLLSEHLEFFQSSDEGKICYENGQDVVKQVLDQSIGFMLKKASQSVARFQ